MYRRISDAVWCPKCRGPVIGGGSTSDLLVSRDPQFGIHRLVKQVKGCRLRVLREDSPHLRSRLPTLWTNSYFIATVGEATLEVVKRYVENQRNVQGAPLPPHG